MKLVLVCLFILMALEAYLAPFTKVEESFNLQATFDILHKSQHYDHLEFPGVVPRTFVGATLLSAFAWPFIQLTRISLLNQQILVRVILAGCVVFSLGQFASGVRTLFGSRTSTITIMLLLCQFHLVFWSSRTLPNTLALPWVELGLSHWLVSLSQASGRTQHLTWMIRYLTFTGVVFRFEVGILLVILLGTEYMHGTIGLKSAIKQVAATGLLSLALTVSLDSLFWNRWLWPEGEVFYFNVILNKSSEWGTLPFYAYFMSLLPRLLLISWPLAMVGFMTDARIRRLLMPMIIYVGIFSCLPHKEWRFIMYTVPAFTAAAAASVSSAMTAASRSWYYRVVLFLMLGGAAASFVISMTMFQISRFNYPGGDALLALHTIEAHRPHVSVHMDSDAAMTGVSLYGQSNSRWHYSRNESHQTQQHFIDARYTHIITSHPQKFDTALFEVIDEALGVDQVKLKNWTEYKNGPGFSPIQFKMPTKLYTLRLIQPQKTWIQSTLHEYPVVLYSKTYW
jgi:alpha-1,6-mannosyltransferase